MNSQEVQHGNRPHVSDPAVMLGKPVVEGTRITVEAIILERLAAGEAENQLLEAWPRTTREDLRAALSYAADRGKNAVR